LVKGGIARSRDSAMKISSLAMCSSIGRTILDVDNSWFTLRSLRWIRVSRSHCLAVGACVRSALNWSPTWVGTRWRRSIRSSPAIPSTLRARSCTSANRRADPRKGLVTVSTRVLNQGGIEVMSFERTMLIYKRGH
jgi:itaconyl-CoA hydratase